MDALTLIAQEATAWQPDTFKFLAAGIALAAAALSLGMIGMNYMKSLGRNPEAGKAAGFNIIIIAAMVELSALLAFVVMLG